MLNINLEEIETEEEKKIVIYLRNKQVIAQIKNMNDDEFINFRETILRNFKVVEEMFNCIFYKRLNDIEDIESFIYDDLFQYYYKKIKEVLEYNYLTFACIQCIHKDFMMPFYQYKDESLLVLGSRDSYINYLESKLDKDYLVVEKVYSFNNDLYNYFKDKIGYSFVQDNFEPSDLGVIPLILERNGISSNGNWKLDKASGLIEDFKRSNECIFYESFYMKKFVSSLISRIPNIADIIKKNVIFLTNKDLEQLNKFYNDLYDFYKDVIECLNKDSLKYRYDKYILENRYNNLFSLTSDNKKKVFNYFKSNGYDIFGLVRLLDEVIDDYFTNKKESNKTKNIKTLLNCYPNMRYLDDNTMDYFIEHNLDYNIFNEYYKLTNDKAKLYMFLNVYFSDDDKKILKDYLKKINIENICDDINDMLVKNGCNNINLIENDYVDKLIYFYIVKSKFSSVSSVDEKEVFSTVFSPVYEKVKK